LPEGGKFMNQFDVIIVGAGPGGYVAAIRSAQLGKKTCIIEDEQLGGVCLNWGCIPTKALLKASEIYADIQKTEEFGFKIEPPKVDMKQVVARSRAVSSKLNQGITHLLKKNKVTVIKGYARFKGPKELSVSKEGGRSDIYKADNIILATGARPKELPSLPFDQKIILSSKEAMIQEKLPKNLLIIGSGAIGIEFASFFQAFGSKVTIIELQDRILPAEDAEISQMAQKAFERKGIEIFTKTTLDVIEKNAKGVKIVLKGAMGVQERIYNKAIVAIGVVPNTNDLGLETTKVQVLENGQIKVSDIYETSEPGIYAIGDIISPPWLAHKASHEGVIVAEKISGKSVHGLSPENIPGCTYSSPQIASLGHTEAYLKEKGIAYRVGRFPFQGNGKAIALGKPDGLIKLLFSEKTGELLGAHMIGADVTEMIHSMAIAKKLETTEQELMETVFPHPTLSEMIHEATLDAFDQVIHF
jgi:dihydrolipoamide dehydrogenase